MSSSRSFRLALLLIPLLIARAFVPAGFMLSAQAGSLQLVFCSATKMPSLAQSSDTHAHHQQMAGGMEHHHGGSQQASHDNAPCPFALAGVACIDGISRLAAAVPPPGIDAAAYPATAHFRARLAQLDRIRGPPALV